MTLNEAIKCSERFPVNQWTAPLEHAAIVLAAEVRRLQSENTALRLYAPARRAQPTVKTAQIAPTNWPAWGMIDETDEEFAERAGRKIAEVGR